MSGTLLEYRSQIPYIQRHLIFFPVLGRVRAVPDHGLHRVPAVEHEQGALRGPLPLPLPHRPRHPRRRPRRPHPLREGGAVDRQVCDLSYWFISTWTTIVHVI